MKTLNIKEIYAVNGAGLSLGLPPLRLPIKCFPPISTRAVGEEEGTPIKDPCFPKLTTLALGEEGDSGSSLQDLKVQQSPFGNF
ncbi:hypothetical protein [Acinetobacter shaoyimingii]|uniref:Uncharacterized protein n=1 Tax=Acinetobacter shaoyimingii TaxID=2715164 RepID=A0A6G8RWH2_9GAMM|nr:hypothetical protein [Acinetobacter shaoyimingii]NHB57190.1 hypothetical protein [Acinetobacter shaoyimingii]QIO06201.1 hypothetical protein G8E00_09645 [Acinetobacter shaoyimingii]